MDTGMAGDGDQLSLGEAAKMLRQKKRGKLAEKRARLMLISALREGDLTAFADEFSQGCDVPRYKPIIDTDTGVPAWFWNELHHEHHANGSGYVPTGPYGDWTTSNFELSVSQYAVILAQTFPNFSDIGYLGSQSIYYQANALGCKVFRLDVERLATRSANGVIERARRKPFWTTGNLTASNKEKLLARICALFLHTGDQAEIASSPEMMKQALQNVALWDDGNPLDHSVNSDFYARFSALVSAESFDILCKKGAP